MTDRELLTLYVDQADSQAFAQLVQRHAAMVYAVARRLAPADAEDVTQAAFLVLMQKATTLGNHTDLATWLHRVTAYCAANARRAQRRRTYHERHSAMPAQSADEQRGMSEVLDRAIARLSEPYRAVVLLRYCEGLSVEQTSQRLGLSSAAVAKRSERAIQRLRDLLQTASGTSCSVASVTAVLAGEAAVPPPGHLLEALARPTTSATALAQGTSHSLMLAAIKGAVVMSLPVVLLLVAAAVVVVSQVQSADSIQPRGAPTPAGRSPVAPRPQPQPQVSLETWTNSLAMRFVRIPAGRFTMGSPLSPQEGVVRYGGEPGYYTGSPQREVEIRQPFLMAAGPVTRGQFAQFIRETGYRTTAELRGTACGLGVGGWRDEKGWNWRNPGIPQTDEHPVVSVSWDDAQAFCTWLSEKDGRLYRLPSEEQWEYACRAGTQTEFYWGDDARLATRYANLFGEMTARWMAGDKDPPADPDGRDDGFAVTAPVGSFPPNPWGLHDMCGNAGQWCSDVLVEPGQEGRAAPDTGDLPRVVRGGAWYLEPARSRSAYRYGAAASHSCNDVTFRVITD